MRERQASAKLRPGDIVFTKVVRLDGEAVMLGCALYAIPARNLDAIVELGERIARNREVNAESLHDYDLEMCELYLRVREDMVNPVPHDLQNTDGEPLQITRMDYELDCPPQDAFSSLLPLTLEDDPEAFSDECERDGAGELVAVQIPWLREGNAKNPGWPNTVMGQIEIRQGRMTVNVNSQPRAEAIQSQIAARLGPRTRLKGILVESMEQMMAATAVADPSSARSERKRERGEFNQTPEAHILRCLSGSREGLAIIISYLYSFGYFSGKAGGFPLTLVWRRTLQPVHLSGMIRDVLGCSWNLGLTPGLKCGLQSTGPKTQKKLVQASRCGNLRIGSESSFGLTSKTIAAHILLVKLLLNRFRIWKTWDQECPQGVDSVCIFMR